MEEWKSVVGFEDYYEVSNLGRVRSCLRCVPHSRGGIATKQSKIISKGKIWSGYEKVGLSKNGRPFTRAVHRIVCQAFHGDPPSDKHHASHINGKRDDNKSENLRWLLPTENEADKIRHGTIASGKRNGKYTKPEKTPRGTQHGCHKLTEEQVGAVRHVRSKYALSLKLLGELTGVSRVQIGNIISEKHWSHI